MPPTKSKPQALNRRLTSSAQSLYEACSKSPKKTDFTNEDLQRMSGNSDSEALLALCEELHAAMLLVYITSESSSSSSTTSSTRLTYRLRTQPTASQLLSLDDSSQTVYKQIEAAGTAGMWTKHLRLKTQIHQTTLTTSLKKLESKLLVKQTKNVSYPGRKLYMLSYLEPTDEATGGPWYVDGEPDTSLIDTVKGLAVDKIRRQSWRHGPKKLIVDEEGSKRLVEVEREKGLPEVEMGRMLLPHPAGYMEYPTASSILAWINENGIISGKDIKVQDVQQLLNVLMYEARIEPMGMKMVTSADSDDEEDTNTSHEHAEMMYRSTRLTDGQKGPGSAFADTPCARCPVFRLCEDGGPVNATSCGYFEKWLAI